MLCAFQNRVTNNITCSCENPVNCQNSNPVTLSISFISRLVGSECRTNAEADTRYLLNGRINYEVPYKNQFGGRSSSWLSF